MPRANYTLAAEFDLGQIVDRIAEENVSAAVNWIFKTRAICELLADQPELGQRVLTKQYGELRRHIVGNYLIYYHPTSQGIDVVHVFHGARDQGKLL